LGNIIGLVFDRRTADVTNHEVLDAENGPQAISISISGML
jgi:hypothetical protein